jgi:uncharacterized protein YjbI with pentapeptide repeats
MRFWNGMKKKLVANLTDKILVGDDATGESQYMNIEDLPMVKSTKTPAYKDYTNAEMLALPDGLYNYWHGQLLVQSCYNEQGVKIGAYQYQFSSGGMQWRRVDFATAGEVQVFPEFNNTWNTSVLQEIFDSKVNTSGTNRLITLLEVAELAKVKDKADLVDGKVPLEQLPAIPSAEAKSMVINIQWWFNDSNTFPNSMDGAIDTDIMYHPSTGKLYCYTSQEWLEIPILAGWEYIAPAYNGYYNQGDSKVYILDIEAGSATYNTLIKNLDYTIGAEIQTLNENLANLQNSALQAIPLDSITEEPSDPSTVSSGLYYKPSDKNIYQQQGPNWAVWENPYVDGMLFSFQNRIYHYSTQAGLVLFMPIAIDPNEGDTSKFLNQKGEFVTIGTPTPPAVDRTPLTESIQENGVYTNKTIAADYFQTHSIAFILGCTFTNCDFTNVVFSGGPSFGSFINNISISNTKFINCIMTGIDFGCGEAFKSINMGFFNPASLDNVVFENCTMGDQHINVPCTPIDSFFDPGNTGNAWVQMGGGYENYTVENIPADKFSNRDTYGTYHMRALLANEQFMFDSGAFMLYVAPSDSAGFAVARSNISDSVGFGLKVDNVIYYFHADSLGWYI